MQITHNFVSALPDGPDASLLQPSHWNEEHTITGLVEMPELPTADGRYILNIIGGVATWEILNIT